MDKTWTEIDVVKLLQAHDRAVEKAMVAIFNRQTEAEKRTESTHVLNMRGFSASDAQRGSYLARWVLSGRRLTGRHLIRARQMALKYRLQLVEVANQSNVMPKDDVSIFVEAEGGTLVTEASDICPAGKPLPTYIRARGQLFTLSRQVRDDDGDLAATVYWCSASGKELHVLND